MPRTFVLRDFATADAIYDIERTVAEVVARGDLAARDGRAFLDEQRAAADRGLFFSSLTFFEAGESGPEAPDPVVAAIAPLHGGVAGPGCMARKTDGKEVFPVCPPGRTPDKSDRKRPIRERTPSDPGSTRAQGRARRRSAGTDGFW
jgi:hypothetical protein